MVITQNQIETQDETKKNQYKYSRENFFKLGLEVYKTKFYYNNLYFFYQIFFLSFSIFLILITNSLIISLFFFITFIIFAILGYTKKKYNSPWEENIIEKNKDFFNGFNKYLFNEENENKLSIEHGCSYWYNIVKYARTIRDTFFKILIIILEVAFIILHFILFLYAFFDYIIPLYTLDANFFLVQILNFYLWQLLLILLLFGLDFIESYINRFRWIFDEIITFKYNQFYHDSNDIIYNLEIDKDYIQLDEKIKEQLYNLKNLLTFNILRNVSEVDGNIVNYYNKLALMNFIRLTYIYETFIFDLIQKEKNSNNKRVFQNNLDLIKNIQKGLKLELEYKIEIFEKPKSFFYNLSSIRISIISIVIGILLFILRQII